MTNHKTGIAMIAYNAEDLIPQTLDQFKGVVNEIAIVLGGKSHDNTRAVAEQYATQPVEDFKGPLLNGMSPPELNGRLAHFGQARQQSFDILERCGCEYALVVDTDDVWNGIDKLEQVIDRMAQGNFTMTMFPYFYEGGHFVQPRIYRIGAGHWEGPCHNYFEIAEKQRVALQTDLMSMRQERPANSGLIRRIQNIEISKMWMAENGDNCRLLQHMAKDLMVDHQYAEVEDCLNRYFVQYDLEGRQDPEEYYTALQTMAVVYLVTNRFKKSLQTAFDSLSVRNHSQSWVLAAEASSLLAKGSVNEVSLLELSLFCAEQALRIGKPRRNLHWHSDRITSGMPWLLKARALAGLGRARDALGALDIGLMVEPENEDMSRMRKDICRMLGELA